MPGPPAFETFLLCQVGCAVPRSPHLATLGSLATRGDPVTPQRAPDRSATMVSLRDLLSFELVAAQQLVYARLGARFRVDLFHDDRAIEAAAAVGSWKRARNHHRARRHAPIENLAGVTAIDLGAGADENTHGDDAAFLDHHAFDDL